MRPKIKMDKIPDLSEIIVLHSTSPKIFKYIGSLKYSLQWKIKKIKGKIEYSRSGLSAYIDKIYVQSETNKHVHEVFIREAYIENERYSIPVALADWNIDGEEGLVIIPKWIMERIRSIIEAFVKLNEINEGEFEFELRQCRVLAPGDWY